MAQMGHEVHLFAAPGSKCPTNGFLHYVRGSYGIINSAFEREVYGWHWGEIKKADYIIDCSHLHIVGERIYHQHPEYKDRVVNVLNGLVTWMPDPPYNLILGSKAWYTLSILGWSQFFGTHWEEEYGRTIPPLNPEACRGIIYWRCNTDFYAPSGYEKDDYFLCLGRPTPYKGLHNAILVAAKLGVTLKVVMPMQNPEHKHWGEFYLETIRDANSKGANIQVVSLPENSQSHLLKRELYRRAKALLFPIEAHEPFGLVVIEALSCGTPVIASNMGAMPEILRHEKTGFLCYGLDDIENAVKRIDETNPEECRREAVMRFDRKQSAVQFLALAPQEVSE